LNYKAENGNDGLLFLDGLRGLAAFYVMVGHARWLLWEGYEGFQRHPASYSAINKALVYFFTLFKYGHEAVLFFFVLSGFVIHLRYARRIAGQGMAAKFDWAAFVWRRARRLYPPLLAAMALALVLDNIGKAAGFSIYNQDTPYPVINTSLISHLDGVTALGNLAFVMNTYVPVFGCNGPLWSLKFEWWFYMIYPAFWWLSRRSIALATALMAGLFVASFFPAGWPLRLLHDVFTAMLAWWLGALLADIFAGRLAWRWHWVAFGAGLAGLLALRFAGGLHDLGMGLMFSAVLAGGFLLEEQKTRLRWLEKLKPLGDMSYTLYVTHFTVLVLTGGWLMSRSPKGLLPQHFGWVFGGIATTTLIAYGLSFIVERPFLNRVPHQKNNRWLAAAHKSGKMNTNG
jgi:peptidoglycan/LPS O-acetylase OafA/YrhL